MECKRKRELSECFSVESMSMSSSGSPPSVSSGEASPGVLDNIVTNTTYLENLPTEILISPGSRFSRLNHPTHNDFGQETGCSPRQDTTNITVYEPDAVATAALTHQVFPMLDPRQIPPGFKTLTPLFARFLKDTPPAVLGEVITRLKRHLYLKKNNRLSVNLVAAAILRFHPELRERRYTEDSVSVPQVLPCIIREKLSCGLHVPMVHVLYGEALVNGYASHVNTCGQQVGAEPYPISLSTSPPKEFCALIKRVDVIRGMTSHAMALAFRFPCLAASMHGLCHHMWTLLFSKKMSATAGMELYDTFFLEFQKQLALAIVMPMDRFPPRLIEIISAVRFDKNTAVAPTR